MRRADGSTIFPPIETTPVASLEDDVSLEGRSAEERLESVQALLEEGLITKEEAAEKRQEILDDI